MFFLFPLTTQMLFKPFKCHLILAHKAFLLKPKTCWRLTSGGISVENEESGRCCKNRGSLVIFSFLSSAFGMDRHTVYGVNSVPFKYVATHTHTSVQILPHLVLHCPIQQMYIYVCKSTRVTRLHKLSATRKLHSHTLTHTHAPLSISTGDQDRELWK